MPDVRIEKDSLGEMKVPAEALWGPQTQRAVENFPISGRPLPPAFIHTLGLLKASAARVNRELGLLAPPLAEAIEKAANEVAEGRWDREFPIDVFQTGSATSSNMNANEVIARLASRASGLKVHPNDHVNFGQSSNDVIPTAIHVSAVVQIERDLLPSLARLWKELDEKSREFHDVLKTGRTHLMDATPIRLGQEFSGYASQVQHGIARVKATLPDLRELAIGGTAVGTGLNTHPEFGRRMAAEIGKLAGTSFSEAPNHFEAQGALPAIQPGSSIMPGKVNPVVCEAVTMVAAQVMGNHVAITVGAQWGQLDLNVMLPMMAKNLLESIQLLAAASRVFADKALAGLVANADTCRDYIEISPSMATALNPLIGYDKAAEIAKRSFKERRPVRELAAEMTKLSKAEIDQALDPARQTEPGLELGGGAGG